MALWTDTLSVEPAAAHKLDEVCAPTPRCRSLLARFEQAARVEICTEMMYLPIRRWPCAVF